MRRGGTLLVSPTGILAVTAVILGSIPELATMQSSLSKEARKGPFSHPSFLAGPAAPAPAAAASGGAGALSSASRILLPQKSKISRHDASPASHLPAQSGPVRLRGGSSLFATPEDFRRAGVPINDKTLEQLDLVHAHKEEDLLEDRWEFQYLEKNRTYEVGGLDYGQGYDEEVTTLMMIRLAIERADLQLLLKAMHNAEVIEELQNMWTERLQEAYDIGLEVEKELWRKNLPRVVRRDDEEHGTVYMTPEEAHGPRFPIPVALAKGHRTTGDTIWGPRDGASRLRTDPNMTMDENFALWDALESNTIRTRVLPEIQNLSFDDAFLEAQYQELADMPPKATYPGCNLKWSALKLMAINRAEEAIAKGERGEVGSKWYNLEPAEEHEESRYPDGAWWYIRGHVERMPGLYFKNCMYVWNHEEDDEDVLVECCPDCGFDDCPVAKWEIERIRRLRAYNDGKNEPKIDPLDIMILAGMPRHELDRMLLNATDEGDINGVRRLLAAGANINCTVHDGGGNTPIHYAAIGAHEDLVHLLVTRYGADINARTVAGATPLHHAAHAGHMRMCELLVKLGADVNARCDIGWTPLMEGADSTHNFTVCKLLQLGADPMAENEEGLTALNVAEQRYCSDITVVLRKVMNKTKCECHMCAGYSLGYNNRGKTHVTEDKSSDWFWDTWDEKKMYPKTFAEEMAEAEEKAQEEIAKHAAKEPYGFESTDNMGSMATLNQTWWLEEVEKKKEEFTQEYQETYGGDVGWPDPDPDAIKFYEKAKARREKQAQEREE